eukprot:TRINITY_DN9420_c0_g1_i1.p2 TRINITY_DN9420_c0_g1~~TRINITY_DN9420_c0_g1_i1.p2  ORF type:complete len:200 (+),score=16.08 TRINITY_DN9420_c0_g1_i1:1286-1885(+)
MSSSAPETPMSLARQPSRIAKLQQTMALQNWSLILSALSTFASIIYFYHALKGMRNSSEASIFNTVHSEYSHPKMLDSFAELENFLEATGPEAYIEQYNKEIAANSEFGRELEHARRHIQAWYSKVAYFHQFDLLHDRYLKAFPGPARCRHFLRLVEPLSHARTRRHGIEAPPVFKHFRDFYGIHETSLGDASEDKEEL